MKKLSANTINSIFHDRRALARFSIGKHAHGNVQYRHSWRTSAESWTRIPFPGTSTKPLRRRFTISFRVWQRGKVLTAGRLLHTIICAFMAKSGSNCHMASCFNRDQIFAGFLWNIFKEDSFFSIIHSSPLSSVLTNPSRNRTLIYAVFSWFLLTAI